MFSAARPTALSTLTWCPSANGSPSCQSQQNLLQSRYQNHLLTPWAWNLLTQTHLPTQHLLQVRHLLQIRHPLQTQHHPMGIRLYLPGLARGLPLSLVLDHEMGLCYKSAWGIS